MEGIAVLEHVLRNHFNCLMWERGEAVFAIGDDGAPMAMFKATTLAGLVEKMKGGVEMKDIFGYMIGVGLSEFWQAHDDDEWYEYNLWLEAHGLHDQEEPSEDTFVGHDNDGEEIHVVDTVFDVAEVTL